LTERKFVMQTDFLDRNSRTRIAAPKNSTPVCRATPLRSALSFLSAAASALHGRVPYDAVPSMIMGMSRVPPQGM